MYRDGSEIGHTCATTMIDVHDHDHHHLDDFDYTYNHNYLKLTNMGQQIQIWETIKIKNRIKLENGNEKKCPEELRRYAPTKV